MQDFSKILHFFVNQMNFQFVIISENRFMMLG